MLKQVSESFHDAYLRAFHGLGSKPGPRALPGRAAIAILLYIAAVAGREGLHLIVPGSVRYLTFFPALMAAGFLCGPLPSFTLLLAFAISGLFWSEAPEVAPWIHLLLMISFLVAGSGVVLPALYAVAAKHKLEQHDEHVALLNAELRHRIKNILAVTSSICTQTLRLRTRAYDEAEVCSDISSRIRAVANAQDLLSLTRNEGVDLAKLTNSIIEPFCPHPSRMSIQGPPTKIPEGATTYLALVLHELATNAIKYGAWSSGHEGTVSIMWRLDHNALWVRWRENGVAISPPTSRGFGTDLIQEGRHVAEVQHLFHPDGVECTVTFTV